MREKENGHIKISAKITGVSYTPFLCKKLICYNEKDFASVINSQSAFLLEINNNTVAVSTWVSPKRTRSYPYSRVYNTLTHSGKKITIIPFVKDEGAEGDRDFIQWDTISLMSLLGINVVIAYYSKAEKNNNYANKITNQQFDVDFVLQEIKKLLSYQSDALHWNIEQIDKLSYIAQLSKKSYKKISVSTGVQLHSEEGINKRIEIITNNKNDFMNLSRDNAQSAQNREIHTVQPKENITDGIKAQINITNYLGGTYYFTADEAIIKSGTVFIIEGKHTKGGVLPSEDDIKDGLVKMILYSNLCNVKINGQDFKAAPVLKLTNTMSKDEGIKLCTKKQKLLIHTLIKEAMTNNFKLDMPFGVQNEN